MEVRCGICGGSGIIEVPEENGYGYAYTQDECPLCNGTGIITVIQKPQDDATEAERR